MLSRLEQHGLATALGVAVIGIGAGFALRETIPPEVIAAAAGVTVALLAMLAQQTIP